MLDPLFSNPSDDFLSWKRTIYRFYAWFLTFWVAASFIGRFSVESTILIPDLAYLDVLVSVPALVGMIFFAYRKSILWPWFWRIYTPFVMGWDLWGSLWFIQTPEECLYFFQQGWIELAVQYILLLPMYLGIFRLGFPR